MSATEQFNQANDSILDGAVCARSVQPRLVCSIDQPTTAIQEPGLMLSEIERLGPLVGERLGLHWAISVAADKCDRLFRSGETKKARSMSTKKKKRQRRQQNLEATHGAGCEYEVDRAVQETAALRLALENCQASIRRVESIRRYTDSLRLAEASHRWTVLWCNLLREQRRLNDAIKQKTS